jgi:capsule polysaccharide export protein KpsE/RkpR
MIEEVLLSVDTLNGKPITMADYLIKINRSEKKANAKSRTANVSFPVTMPREKFSYLQDSVLFVMYEDITKGSLSLKRPDRKLNLYEVKMTTPDERFSKRFVEKLLAATSAYYSQLRTKRSKKTLDELEKMVVNMRSATKSAIQGRASIQDANVNPALAAQGAQLQQKQLDISAYGAAYSELFKNLELARYQYLQDVPLLEVIDYPNYPMKRLKSGRLLTGLTIAFVFGFLTIMGLLIRKIVRDSLNSVPNEGDQSVQASPGT